jgi:hypothetical protein
LPTTSRLYQTQLEYCSIITLESQASLNSLNLVLYSYSWIGDSAVGIATDYGLDKRGVGVRVPIGSRIFSMSSRPALVSIQPPIQWVPRGSFPGGKTAGA